MAIAEYHIQFALMTGRGTTLFRKIHLLPNEIEATHNAVANCHRVTRVGHFRFLNGYQRMFAVIEPSNPSGML